MAAFGVAVWVGPALTAVGGPQADYGRVELVRDRWGVPHVFSDTDEGAMYGLGYAMAEDRLYQMSLSLRIMQGRLAEVLGDVKKGRSKKGGINTALQSDRLMRTFGFYRAAEKAAANLDEATRGLLAAYSEGVNDFVEGHAGPTAAGTRWPGSLRRAGGRGLHEGDERRAAR